MTSPKDTPTSYTIALNQTTDVIDEIADATRLFINGKKMIDQAVARLITLNATAEAGGYATLVAYINQQAAANPGDVQWQQLKGQIGKIVADFSASKALMQAKVAAFDGA